MTPNSAKASIQGWATEVRKRSAKRVLFIFAISFGSSEAYLARILPLAASCRVSFAQRAASPIPFRKRAATPAVHVAPRQPERCKARPGAHGVEQVGDSRRTPPQGERQVGLGEHGGVRRHRGGAARASARTASVDELDVARGDAVGLQPLQQADVRDRVRGVDSDPLPDEGRAPA